ATGNIGPAIVTELVEAGFEVTVFSRSPSAKTDSHARVQQVDYASKESLVAALKNQDALVNTLPMNVIPLDVHLRILDAARAAGIKRYLPSEFGCDLSDKEIASLPVFADKATIGDKLSETSQQDPSFTWTRVYTGPFLDWGIEVNFFINLKGPSTEIYNGGDVPVSSTTVAGVGQAVVGVLKHLEETKNRCVFASNTTFSQNKLLELSGNADKVKRVDVKAEDLLKRADEALKQSSPDFKTAFVSQILYAIFAGKFGNHYTKTDNELLGVQTLSEAELAEVVRKYA
ncbi:Uncharacterized protein PECH_006576, partial [Penicillium ucsense]